MSRLWPLRARALQWPGGLLHTAPGLHLPVTAKDRCTVRGWWVTVTVTPNYPEEIPWPRMGQFKCTGQQPNGLKHKSV